MMPDGKVRVMVHTGPGWDGALIIEAPTYKGPSVREAHVF